MQDLNDFMHTLHDIYACANTYKHSLHNALEGSDKQKN